MMTRVMTHLTMRVMTHVTMRVLTRLMKRVTTLLMPLVMARMMILAMTGGMVGVVAGRHGLGSIEPVLYCLSIQYKIGRFRSTGRVSRPVDCRLGGVADGGQFSTPGRDLKKRISFKWPPWERRPAAIECQSRRDAAPTGGNRC